MMIPYYEIRDEVGRSGKFLGNISLSCTRFLRILTVHWSEKQIVPFYKEPVMKQMNPFRDLQYGGTTLGIKGKNFWFSDDTLVGFVLKLIYE